MAGESSDSVKIVSISITPDPPEKGQKVTADAKLEFSKFIPLSIMLYTGRYWHC